MTRESCKSLSLLAIFATAITFVGQAAFSPISQAKDARQTSSKNSKPVARPLSRVLWLMNNGSQFRASRFTPTTVAECLRRRPLAPTEPFVFNHHGRLMEW